MKKLPHFKPSLVTKAFFPHHHPSYINEGECFIWAYYASLLFKDVRLWHLSHHAFVRYHGRFYDSEVLRGSPDWQDLPATKCSYPCRPEPVSVQQFKDRWNFIHLYNVSWEKMEADAQRFLGSLGT
jgi:hypothetical protein